MRGVRHFLLAVLVALAGCAGAFGGNTGSRAMPDETPAATAGQPATATPTVKPVSTATSTPASSDPSVDPELKTRYSTLTDRVGAQTVSLLDSKIINETTVGYLVDQNTNNTLNQMFRGEATPVPQAVALEMARMNAPPERVVFHIVNDDSQRIFTSSFTVDNTRAYKNPTLMPNEFRNLVIESNGVQRRQSRQFENVVRLGNRRPFSS